MLSLQGVAQLGSASVLGTGGHRFKSYHSDEYNSTLYIHYCRATPKYMNVSLYQRSRIMEPMDFMHRFAKQLIYKELIFMDQIQFLAVSIILFLLGIWGIFLNRKNIIIMLMSIELMLLAVNLNFLVFSIYLDDLIGQLFALLILTVAAAESAIGLALLVVYYRVRGTISVEFINLMRG